MTEPKDTRENERGIVEKQCPYCEDWKDPRGFSSHARNCPERPEQESEQNATRSESNQNMTDENEEDEYEEVTSGTKVEMNEDPHCEECGTLLRNADDYARRLRETASSGEWDGKKLSQEEKNYLHERANFVEDYYAVCLECELCYEKTEL